MRPWNKLKTREQKWRRLKDMAQQRWWKIKRPFETAWYWLRTHTINRYHIVNCKSPQNDYSWGWCDRDWLMLCACFNILVDFVEKESPHLMKYISLGEYLEQHSSQQNWPDERTMLTNNYNDDSEIRRLYVWWKVGRSEEHAAADRLSERIPRGKGVPNNVDDGETWKEMCIDLGMNTPEWNTWSEAREVLDKRDNEMLYRLIRLRERLWT